jgi:hypothetical protein
MAERRSKSGSNGRRSKSGSRNGSRAAPDVPDYSVTDPKKIPDGPDVLVDVPTVKVDEIELEVDDLRAQVAVVAEVQQLVQLSVGVDAQLGKVDLKIEGVEAQALLKARLHNVSAILERVLMSLDRNPELLSSVGRAVQDVGSGAGRTLKGAGEAVEDVEEGAGQATRQIGQGAGQGVQDIGQGTGRAAKGAGKGVKQAGGQLAQGKG